MRSVKRCNCHCVDTPTSASIDIGRRARITADNVHATFRMPACPIDIGPGPSARHSYLPRGHRVEAPMPRTRIPSRASTARNAHHHHHQHHHPKQADQTPRIRAKTIVRRKRPASQKAHRRSNHLDPEQSRSLKRTSSLHNNQIKTKRA